MRGGDQPGRGRLAVGVEGRGERRRASSERPGVLEQVHPLGEQRAVVLLASELSLDHLQCLRDPSGYREAIHHQGNRRAADRPGWKRDERLAARSGGLGGARADVQRAGAQRERLCPARRVGW